MYRFEPTWRWYGPDDPITLNEIRQTGATGVVTSLHNIPNGQVWPCEAIDNRIIEIEKAGLRWSVVESLPVHEDIKRASGNFKTYIENYKQSLINLSLSGVNIVTYNFMPVLDWTRTNLNYPMPDGSTGLYFDQTAFIAFDVYILKRDNAARDYNDIQLKKAYKYFRKMSFSDKKQLTNNIIAGLPGGTTKGMTDISTLREILKTYNNLDTEQIRQNLLYFLDEVIPVAEEMNVKMALHPDDPPYSLLGLPRIVSNSTDLANIFNHVNSKNCGLCFCTGSLGVDPNNKLSEIIIDHSERIHFVHLRSTKRDTDGNFFEANHLGGDVDMYTIIKNLILSANRQNVKIPMRPDHGHVMLDDQNKNNSPGYTLIGRMRGLAELRGLELGIIRSLNDLGKN